MRDDLTDITVLLDRTGSMQSVKGEVISGYNAFVEEQAKAVGSALLTLIQFDSQDPFEVVCKGVPVGEARRLNEDNYVPRGMTPLLDAIGLTIVDTGSRLEHMPEGDRPSKVVVVIMTDGQENASHEYTKVRIKEMVEHQRDVYKWQFVFLGANMDAIGEAVAMGMNLGSAGTYDPDSTGQTYTVTSCNVASYRATGDANALNFTAEQRKVMQGKKK